MLKENTVITLHPEDMFRLHGILLDEDRDAAARSLNWNERRRRNLSPTGWNMSRNN
jgi:hypothetical protein